MCSSVDHGDAAIVHQEFFHCGAITKPVEMAAPEEFPILADCPPYTGAFASERMEFPFNGIATAGAEEDWFQASAGH